MKSGRRLRRSSVPSFRVIDIRAIEPFHIAQEMSRLDDAWVLLYGFDHWTPQRWHAADSTEIPAFGKMARLGSYSALRR